MKQFAIITFAAAAMLLLTFFPATLTSCSAGRGLHLEQQEISIKLDPDRHLLMGTSTLTLSSDAGRVELMLSPQAIIDETTVAGNQVQGSFSKGALTIRLPPDAAERKVNVTVRYHVLYDQPLPENTLNDEDPSYGVTASIGARGIFLGGDAGWYPQPLALPLRRTVNIEAPDGIEAITAGRRIARATASGLTRSTWTEAHPVGPLALSAGPYRIAERRSNGVDIYTYLYPANAALSTRYLEAAEKYLNFYSQSIGPYPYEKFAVVENFLPTGYGFPSYTLLGGAVLRLPFIADTSLPHEIAHNWWGNGVLPDRDGNWSEGLVTYLADYWLKERKSPQEARDARLQFVADFSTLVPAGKDFPLRDFSGRTDPASRAIGYYKAAMLFHMTRRLVGEAAFFGALQDVFRAKCYHSASWQDFAQAFSRRSGREMVPFFEQWLVRTGGPHLALTHVQRQRTAKGWQVTGRVVQRGTSYALWLPLRLETEDAPLEQTIVLDRPEVEFSFVSPTPPRRLVMDPDYDLFRILPAAELPPTINRLKSSHRLTAVLTPDCAATPETIRLLLQSLGQDQAPLVNEQSLRSEAMGSDLLYCGMPQDRRLIRLPRGIAWSTGGFEVDGLSFQSAVDLLFVAMTHPSTPSGVIALFLPLSEQAAEGTLGKITHYGKYSYLAFSDGQNRRKGTAPSGASESVVEFDAGEKR